MSAGNWKAKELFKILSEQGGHFSRSFENWEGRAEKQELTGWDVPCPSRSITTPSREMCGGIPVSDLLLGLQSLLSDSQESR